MRAVSLTALMVCSAVAGAVVITGTAAAADGTAAPAAVTAEQTTQLGFGPDSNWRDVRRGDPIKAPFRIGFGNETRVTVVITSEFTEDGDYYGNVTIEDTDGDGRAKLHVNTWEMGHSNPFEVEGGTVTRWEQVEYEDPDRLLNKTKTTEQSAYTLLLGSGSDPAAVTGAAADVSYMKVHEAETEGIDIVTAPAGTNLDNGTDLWVERDGFADLKRNFSFEEDSRVASRDVVVLAPWGGGFWGPAEHALDVTDGNRSAALLWLLENGHYNVTFNQTDAAEDQRKVLNFERAVAVDAIDFVSALQYRHLVVAVNTSKPVFQRGGSGEFVAAQSGENFTMGFDKVGRVDHDFENNSDGELVDTHSPWRYRSFEVVEPTAVLDPLPADPGANDTVSGATSLAPGTPLTVAITIGDTTRTTTLVHKPTDGDGRHVWNLTADLSAAQDNESIDVAVSAPAYGTVPLSTRDDATTTTTTTDGGDDRPGGGGKVPGFTAVTALLATVAATVVALRRYD